MPLAHSTPLDAAPYPCYDGPMSEQAKIFLESIWPEEGPGWLVLWSKTRSMFFRSNDPEAADAADELARFQDVYWGLGLQAQPLPSPQRGGTDTVMAIPGLWLDVDVGVHDSGKVYPPTRDKAMELLHALPLDPSIIVDSGYGYHAYWLFNEPFLTPSSVERDEANIASNKWQASFRQQAANRGGWTVDPTFEIARILRLPGTLNHKFDTKNAVTVVENDGKRYNLSDLEEYMVETAYIPGAVVQISDDFELNPAAIYNQTKFFALYNSDERFKQTWDRTRKGFSPSEYDMALASAAAYNNWSDQEIADLIIAHRRLHGSDLKLRIDYYARTISKAREGHEKEKAADLNVATATKDEKLSFLGQEFGFPVLKIVKYDAEDPQYRIYVTDDSSVKLGGVDGILSAERFKRSIAKVMGRVLPAAVTNRRRWERISQTMFDVAESADVGDEATERGILFEWIISYLDENPASPADDSEERNKMAAIQQPFIWEDEVYICLGGDTGLEGYMARRRALITRKEMLAMLHAHGIKKARLSWRDNKQNKTISKNYWRINKNLLESYET